MANERKNPMHYAGGVLLGEIKKVDGTGSGLDADLLDGKHASDFVPIAGGKINGWLNVGDNLTFRTDTEGGNIVIYPPAAIGGRWEIDAYNGNLRLVDWPAGSVSAFVPVYFATDGIHGNLIGNATYATQSTHAENADTLNNTLPVIKGGTGATDAATARSNLGITPGNIGAFPNTGGHLYGALEVGESLRFWSDTEGGNIVLKAPPENGSWWELDAYDGNLRLVHAVQNGAVIPGYFDSEGLHMNVYGSVYGTATSSGNSDGLGGLPPSAFAKRYSATSDVSFYQAAISVNSSYNYWGEALDIFATEIVPTLTPNSAGTIPQSSRAGPIMAISYYKLNDNIFNGIMFGYSQNGILRFSYSTPTRSVTIFE